MSHRSGLLAFFTVFAAVAPSAYAQDSTRAEHEAMYRRYADYHPPRGARVHWRMEDGSFWYTSDRPEGTLVYLVDPAKNARSILIDGERLRQALRLKLGHDLPESAIPFDGLTLAADGKSATFAMGDDDYELDLGTYGVIRLRARSGDAPPLRRTQWASPRYYGATADGCCELRSPDGRWIAGEKHYNLFIRSADDGQVVQSTDDGLKDFDWDFDEYFSDVKWSPDSSRLAAWKVDSRQLNSLPIVHWVKQRKEEVEWVRWRRLDEPLERRELFVVDRPSGKRTRIDLGDGSEMLFEILGWRSDGSKLFLLRTDRYSRTLALLEADPATGAVRVVVTETSETFVRSMQFGTLAPPLADGFALLGDEKRFLWLSERDGWNHVYLYGIDGRLVRRLTDGEFPVDRVVAVDEKSRWVYFMAHPDLQRPYDTHLCRVDLDGRHFKRLTVATGQHEIEFAPSKKYFIDVHSSVDRPMTSELRTADGTLLQVLDRDDFASSRDLRWRPPEEFTVKADDGKTDLYGVLYKPYDFDPSRKYPVVEFIYSDFQHVVTPKTFASSFQFYSGAPIKLAQLGFITIAVDARGTPGRGKKFLDDAFGNWGRREIPDHVAVLRHLAEKRPYMDMERVGIHGYSWGGYFALRAMLLAPDVYRVGVAGAGPVRGWVGRPEPGREEYEYSSNLPLAGNLRGKLLLIHATSDVNVPFSATMQVADALIRAGKFFDLIVIPEEGHPLGPRAGYVEEAMRRYFVDNLRP
jgi:dipeptidyl aminopeptidase/acylaminoacyl peptidase